MVSDEVREAAKAEIRRRIWASQRGKATRAYIREHPELADQYNSSGTIILKNALPASVTAAAITLELSLRARRRELSQAVREWKQAHPDEAEQIRREVFGLPNSSES